MGFIFFFYHFIIPVQYSHFLPRTLFPCVTHVLFFFFFYKKTKKINVYPRGCLVDQARDSRLVTSSQARPGQFVCFFFFLHISRCLFCVILHFISENVHTVPALPLHLWHGLGCPIHYACFNIINKMHVPFFINLAHNVA